MIIERRLLAGLFEVVAVHPPAPPVEGTSMQVFTVNMFPVWAAPGTAGTKIGR